MCEELANSLHRVVSFAYMYISPLLFNHFVYWNGRCGRLRDGRCLYIYVGNSKTPKDECNLKSLKNSRVYVFPNCTRNNTVTY